MTAKASDFASMDTSLARAPRRADGSLPDNALFRLSSTSQFIDKGVDIGLPFNGSAPDMGAFELQTVAGIEKTATVKSFNLDQNYPNPFNPSTTITYTLAQSGFVTLDVYNVIGKKVAELVHNDQQAGSHKIEFNGAQLSSGVYYYRIRAGNNSSMHKMILMK